MEDLQAEWGGKGSFWQRVDRFRQGHLSLGKAGAIR